MKKTNFSRTISLEEGNKVQFTTLATSPLWDKKRAPLYVIRWTVEEDSQLTKDPDHVHGTGGFKVKGWISNEDASTTVALKGLSAANFFLSIYDKECLVGYEIYLLIHSMRIDVNFYLPTSLPSILMVLNAYCNLHQVSTYRTLNKDGIISEGIRG